MAANLSCSLTEISDMFEFVLFFFCFFYCSFYIVTLYLQDKYKDEEQNKTRTKYT